MLSSSCSWPRLWSGALARKMAGLGVVVQARMLAIKLSHSSLKVKSLQLLPAVEVVCGPRMESTLLRPKDMALLLLASGDLLPRQRARDQQADISGSALKARILNELVWLDPEPVQMEAALEQIITLLGEPSGPTRAVAISILEEWQAACASPQFVEWLLAQAVQEGLTSTEGRRRGRKNRQIPASPDSGATGSH
jgi:hypothetical protein